MVVPGTSSGWEFGNLLTPHVQLIIDESPVPPSLQMALHRLKARVSMRSVDKALATGVSSSADVCVILQGEHHSPDVLDRILADASDRACGTMVLGDGLSGYDDPWQDETFAEDDGGVATAVMPRAMTTDELTGHIKALCEVRQPMREMREELDRLRQRDVELTSSARRFDEQLQLASQIQRDLLPDVPVDTWPLSIRTLYLPAERVSGDMYDVSRLDEDRLSFAVADATGHGLPAALLTVFIQNALSGKEVRGDSVHVVAPDELLGRLNDELLRTNLTECQFLTALHAIFDQKSGEIRWARAGAPYPILIRADGSARQLVSVGGLVGIFEDQEFEVVSTQLASGDTLLLYTDGLEAILAKTMGIFEGADILKSRWLAMLVELGVDAAFEQVREWAEMLPDDAWHKDDITAIAVTMS